MVHLVACVLRAMTKQKVINFLRKKCTARENPGYAYGQYLDKVEGVKQ